MTLPRVLALTGDESGCSMWRVWQPFYELQQHGLRAEHAPVHGCPWCSQGSRPEPLRKSNEPWQCSMCGKTSRDSDSTEALLPHVTVGRYNVIVTPRVVWPTAGKGDVWINTIHKAGIAWVYEVDDDVYSPRIIDRQIRLFGSEAKKGRAQLEWERLERIRFLSLCDGVTVSTERLATVVRSYAPETTPVLVVPNAIDGRWFRDTLRGHKRLVPPLTVGWAGGTREDVDVLALAEAWRNLAKRHPEVKFVVQGHIPKPLMDAVPDGQRFTLPWLALQEYPRGLLNIDIGCCPLAPTVFNASKSCIKWYEMTLAGAACVVSPMVYGREVTDGSDALVAETPAEWERQIERLIEDETLRRQIRRAARRTVATKHSLQREWWRWVEAWQEVLERFEHRPRIELPSAARVPQALLLA